MNKISPWMERENAIVNGIMSGQNACGTLQKATADGTLEEFLRLMVRPTLMVCAEEAAQKDHDVRAASTDAENKRFALEFVVQNLGGSVQIDNPAIVEAIKRALPGRMT